MTKIIDRKCIESLYIWHGKTKGADIYFKYEPQWSSGYTFHLSLAETEELYCKLGELIIKARSYIPPEDMDEDL